MSNAPLIHESDVPEYVLPRLLPEGGLATWSAHRKTLIALLSEHAYGHTPQTDPEGGVHVKEISRGHAPHAPGSTRIQLCLAIGPVSNRHAVRVLLYLPPGKVKCCFLGVNFSGNHSIDPDPEIELPRGWMYPWEGTGVVDNRATEAGRGTRSRRWPVGMILEQGCALATFYCGDLGPDQEDHPQCASFKRLFPTPENSASEWGNIGIWAWGLCRVREALAALPELNGTACVAVGHSRMGKAALWAAAGDERFAGVFSNCSGCMGAALSRRCVGETVANITESFPHWFCPRLRSWANKEAEMPFDQHMLLALMAPRPLLVNSAEEDLWADPRGEFLSAVAASEAYTLLGTQGLAGESFPPVGQPLLEHRVGYAIRSGKHDLLPADWTRALTFFPRHV